MCSDYQHLHIVTLSCHACRAVTQKIKVPNLKSLSRFFPPLHERTRERTSIKMHSIESRFVIGSSNILPGGVYVCSFQPVNLTGCGSEGVKRNLSTFGLLLLLLLLLRSTPSLRSFPRCYLCNSSNVRLIDKSSGLFRKPQWGYMKEHQ